MENASKLQNEWDGMRKIVAEMHENEKINP